MSPTLAAVLRVKRGRVGLLGPGKGRLLEEIDRTGSISAAARAMAMSYKRAWDLVADMNRQFREPVVSTSFGGAKGGGAWITPFGREVLAHYQGMLKTLDAALAGDIAWLQQHVADDAGE